MITYKEVSALLEYNPTTGALTWKIDTNREAKAGHPAGCVVRRGYIRVGIKGKSYYAHRLAWLLHYGEWPAQEIDHIDHDRSNNKIDNLRAVDHRDNTKNQTLRKTNTSGVNGVCWFEREQRWVAYVYVAGKPTCLGYFTAFNEAVAARLAANKQHGYHENHGVVS